MLYEHCCTAFQLQNLRNSLNYLFTQFFFLLIHKILTLKKSLAQMLQFYPRIPRCPAQPWYKFQFCIPPRHTYLYTLALALPVGHRVSQLSPKSWAKYWCVQSERSHPRIRVAAANGLVWEKQETNSSRQNPTHFTVHNHPHKNTPQKRVFALKAVISQL